MLTRTLTSRPLAPRRPARNAAPRITNDRAVWGDIRPGWTVPTAPAGSRKRSWSTPRSPTRYWAPTTAPSTRATPARRSARRPSRVPGAAVARAARTIAPPRARKAIAVLAFIVIVPGTIDFRASTPRIHPARASPPVTQAKAPARSGRREIGGVRGNACPRRAEGSISPDACRAETPPEGTVGLRDRPSRPYAPSSCSRGVRKRGVTLTPPRKVVTRSASCSMAEAASLSTSSKRRQTTEVSGR